MSIRSKERLPLFELSLVLVAAVIGWAEFSLLRSRSQAEQSRDDLVRQFNSLREASGYWRLEAQKFQQNNEAQRQVLTELGAELKKQQDQSQELKQEDELTLPETRRVQEEYSALADVIHTNLVEMRAALAGKAPAPGTAELAAFRRRREDLSQWIAKQKERVLLERFDSRSRELKLRFAKERSNSNSGVATLPLDLGALLHQISSSYSNYSAATQNLLASNLSKDPSDPELEKHLGQ